MNFISFCIVLTVVFVALISSAQGEYNEQQARHVLEKHAAQFRQQCANAPRKSETAKCCSAIRGIMGGKWGRFKSQKRVTKQLLAKCKAGTTKEEADKMRNKLRRSKKLNNCASFKQQMQEKFEELKPYCNSSGAEQDQGVAGQQQQHHQQQQQ